MTESIHLIIALTLGLLIGVIFVGNAILWYYNREDYDKWLDDDEDS